MKSTFLNRLPITLLGLPTVIYLLSVGGFYFTVFVTLVICLALIEFYNFKKYVIEDPIVDAVNEIKKIYKLLWRTLDLVGIIYIIPNRRK